MSHRRMGVLVYVLASAPVVFITAIVGYAWVAATLHAQIGRR